MAEDAERLPDTDERVREHTKADVNESIRQAMLIRLTYYADRLDEIEERLNQLEGEWDIERTLEANAATIGLTGLVLAATVDRRWLVLPLTVAGFLLQHSLQGWCPPLPVFRRLGIRTSGEIHQERYALKLLRGDFANRPDAGSSGERAGQALEAVLK